MHQFLLWQSSARLVGWCPLLPKRLPLDCAGAQSLDEELLHVSEQEHNGDDGDDAACGKRSNVRTELAEQIAEADRNCEAVLAADENGGADVANAI